MNCYSRKAFLFYSQSVCQLSHDPISGFLKHGVATPFGSLALLAGPRTCLGVAGSHGVASSPE